MSVPEVGLFLSTTRLSEVDRALAAAREIGFRTIQFGKLAERYYSPTGAQELARLLNQEGLIASGLCIVYDGESYADLSAVHRTVGLLPTETVEERVRYSQCCIDTAADLGIRLVTFHVGMLPADPDDPGYQRLQRAVDQIASYAHRREIEIGLETGQETAEELLALLARLDTPVGINFDGANFIAYSTADPIAALAALYPRVVGVHIKDYAVPTAPGLLSRPAPIGQGAARVDETIRFLLTAGFPGPLILETYDTVDPLRTIAEARVYVLDRIQRIRADDTGNAVS